MSSCGDVDKKPDEADDENPCRVFKPSSSNLELDTRGSRSSVWHMLQERMLLGVRRIGGLRHKKDKKKTKLGTDHVQQNLDYVQKRLSSLLAFLRINFRCRLEKLQ
jgi:hypothetical protein